LRFLGTSRGSRKSPSLKDSNKHDPLEIVAAFYIILSAKRSAADF